MNSTERAILRLKAWEALANWGTSRGAIKIGDKAFPDIEPWNWEQRMEKADELFAWMLKEEDDGP